MSNTESPRTAHDRFRLFIAWYTVILGGFAILLVGMLVLMAYVFDGSLQIYINEFGEANLEVAAFAIICGTVPFGLYVIDSYLRHESA